MFRFRFSSDFKEGSFLIGFVMKDLGLLVRFKEFYVLGEIFAEGRGS